MQIKHLWLATSAAEAAKLDSVQLTVLPARLRSLHRTVRPVRRPCFCSPRPSLQWPASKADSWRRRVRMSSQSFAPHGRTHGRTADIIFECKAAPSTTHLAASTPRCLRPPPQPQMRLLELLERAFDPPAIPMACRHGSHHDQARPEVASASHRRPGHRAQVPALRRTCDSLRIFSRGSRRSRAR
jgi:hypothetical protein